ncbi:MAG: hypothetical protein HQK50_16245 [Oligoflexia bacterium]|nr:hypothetical protein [Oligoflexia bacterium]
MKKTTSLLVLIISVVSSVVFSAHAVTRELAGDWRNFLTTTLHSLECMRLNGSLLVDRVQLLSSHSPCPLIVLHAPTSPTNIAFDLLVQLHRLNLTQVEKIVSDLVKLPYHIPSGLFYNRYQSKNGKSFTVIEPRVSSIDNLHLKIALWAVGQVVPSSQKLIQSLLLRMNLSTFYDFQDGLFYGLWNNGLEKWKYSYWGSEARSLYALSFAFSWVDDPEMLPKVFASSTIEVATLRMGAKNKKLQLLRTWDGGAFQLLLPHLLFNEGEFSPPLLQLLKNYVPFIISEGERRSLSLPAGHSASEAFGGYSGKLGNLALVATSNQDQFDTSLRASWESVVTPHALFLAALLDAPKMLPWIQAATTLKDYDQRTLYHPQLGMMDGYIVAGSGLHQILPLQLSLDQTIIALSLFQLLDPHHHSLIYQLLLKKENAKIYERLQRFYRYFKVQTIPYK